MEQQPSSVTPVQRTQRHRDKHFEILDGLWHQLVQCHAHFPNVPKFIWPQYQPPIFHQMSADLSQEEKRQEIPELYSPSHNITGRCRTMVLVQSLLVQTASHIKAV